MPFFQPIVRLEARQVDLTNAEDLPVLLEWCGGRTTLRGEESVIVVPTHFGDDIAFQGDWIIKALKGDCFVRSDVTFQQAYKQVE